MQRRAPPTCGNGDDALARQRPPHLLHLQGWVRAAPAQHHPRRRQRTRVGGPRADGGGGGTRHVGVPAVEGDGGAVGGGRVARPRQLHAAGRHAAVAPAVHLAAVCEHQGVALGGRGGHQPLAPHRLHQARGGTGGGVAGAVAQLRGGCWGGRGWVCVEGAGLGVGVGWVGVGGMLVHV
jgi:hypothetical protein